MFFDKFIPAVRTAIWVSAQRPPGPGGAIPFGERSSLRGTAPARPPAIPWVESSRGPWNVPIKVRQALSVLFPFSHRGASCKYDGKRTTHIRQNQGEITDGSQIRPGQSQQRDRPYLSRPVSRPQHGTAPGTGSSEPPDAGYYAGRKHRPVRCGNGDRQDLCLSGGRDGVQPLPCRQRAGGPAYHHFHLQHCPPERRV